ncbi:MAG: UDP-2,3-diacylglucosamine diphosphatase [Bacteroidetes bacterium]|nr:UDP-2,3-diacylglucosamine diphosphatase [Bacteroidota bacterium]
MMANKIYFASDFHLGIPDHPQSLEREKKIVAWLEEVRKDAQAIYLMGDVFDFWFEYRTVVPKGYVRLFGKLAEITDAGIPVHLFRGNHDMWAFDYLEKELGLIMHRDPEILDLPGKRFYIAHGDGLGPGDKGYKFIKKVFQNRILQWLFSWIHPDLAIRIANFWSGQSRYLNLTKKEEELKRLTANNSENAPLAIHSRNILADGEQIDYFIYGHWHLPIDVKLTDTCRYINLGDWLTNFTYAVFDGEKLDMIRWMEK